MSFLSPSTPSIAAPPPPPPPPANPPTLASGTVQQSGAAARAAAAGAFASTQKTGPEGDTSDVNTAGKQLLGGEK